MSRTSRPVTAVVAFLLAGCGGARPYQPPALPPPPGPPIVLSEDGPREPPRGVTEAQTELPSPTTAPAVVRPYVAPLPPTPPPPAYTRGEWVHTDDGWLWVPSGSSTVEVEGVPYAYLYTPSYGWTWYVSPWGVGAYWHPQRWRGVWVAPPHVIVRLGPGHHGRWR